MTAHIKSLNKLYKRFIDAGFSIEIRRGEGPVWSVYLLRDGVRTSNRSLVKRTSGETVGAMNLRLKSSRGFRVDSDMYRVLDDLANLIECGAIDEALAASAPTPSLIPSPSVANSPTPASLAPSASATAATPEDRCAN